MQGGLYVCNSFLLFERFFFPIMLMPLFLAAGACLSWSLLSITEEEVCPHRLPHDQDACSIGSVQALSQRWIPKALPVFMHTTIFLIQQSWIRTVSLLSDFFVHAYKFEKGIANEAIVFLWPVQTASWDLKLVKKQWAGALLSVTVLSENHHERVIQFWLAKEEEEITLTLTIASDLSWTTHTDIIMFAPRKNPFWDCCTDVFTSTQAWKLCISCMCISGTATFGICGLHTCKKT